jgi:hypothetical protein
MPTPAGMTTPEEIIKGLREHVPFLVTHSQEKEVLRILRDFRRQYRAYVERNPIDSRIRAKISKWEWLPPKKRGRPSTRPHFKLAAASKPGGRPKGRYDTAFYSPLSISIVLALESRQFSKRELVSLLTEEGIIPEGEDKSDANPYHRLDRMARVGKETIKLHPNLRQNTPKSKTRLVALLRRCATAYRHALMR